ncbi:MAG: cytochrome ubiquinol oxidase subunit I [Chloroflexi bacterium]|nr:cytochrome ubiquinol oxidase subunit I [Chloroflexota bacterium]
MPIDVPVIGARSAVWIASQLHLFFAAFVLGAPIFIVICEWWGQRAGDPRYERLAVETMKVVTIAYSFTAITGAAFGFVLMGAYSQVMAHLFEQMGFIFGLYVLFFFLETLLMYLYWYTWEPLAQRKGVHISIGISLNVVGTVVMLLMNTVGSYMLSPPEAGEAASLWELINNPTWSGLNLHRFIANITLGGFMVALFAAFMFLTTKTREDRAFYDWMGFIGNFIGVATLMALPLAGYIYAKEIFLYDAAIATFLMADKLSWFFVLQGFLVSLLFLGANYYMWMSIRRITGAEVYLGYMRPTFAVMWVGAVIWMTPQNFLPDLTTAVPAGVTREELIIPERAAFIGLMMAKALAVTAIIMFTFLTYMIYRRAIALGSIRWGEIAPQAQYALVFIPAVAVYTMGLMGAIRELARQDWHVYSVLRDTTPYWYTTSLAHTSIMVAIATLAFFALMAFIFWVGFKLGKTA